MTADFSKLKVSLQSKLSTLRAKRKTAVSSFKRKAEAKKIEQIRNSILT